MEELLAYFKERNYTLATAESCTGGLLGAMLTSVPGISAVYGYGLITYSNAAKMKLLGVERETLAAHGAVSEETARGMAQGLSALSGADFALAITGIAGPDGGAEEKPVGLVYLCLLYPGHERMEKRRFSGDRQSIRQQAAEFALLMIRDAMEEGK